MFFYGGILGYAQGLEVVLHAAKAIQDLKHIHFILQGSGPEKEKLEALKNSFSLKNVHFLPPVSKSEMPSVVKSIDVALVPLKNLPLFQGAIPSKVFEALAMKKPILLGVDGEARKHFITNAQAGLFFQPEDVTDLVNQIRFLSDNKSQLQEMGENARKYVSEFFNRNNIAETFLKKLIEKQ